MTCFSIQTHIKLGGRGLTSFLQPDLGCHLSNTRGKHCNLLKKSDCILSSQKKIIDIIIVIGSSARTVRFSYLVASVASCLQWWSFTVALCMYSYDWRSLVMCFLTPADC